VGCHDAGAPTASCTATSSVSDISTETPHRVSTATSKGSFGGTS